LKNRGPFKLVYKEEYTTLKEARERERQIESYKGGNAFKKLIKRV
jgi:predicted GIY-YIG superfamily endonuclease